MQQVNPKINHIHQSPIINKTPNWIEIKLGKSTRLPIFFTEADQEKLRPKKNNEKKGTPKVPNLHLEDKTKAD